MKQKVTETKLEKFIYRKGSQSSKILKTPQILPFNPILNKNHHKLKLIILN